MSDDQEMIEALAEAAVNAWDMTVRELGDRARWSPKLTAYDLVAGIQLVVLPDTSGRDEILGLVRAAAAELLSPYVRLLSLTTDSYGTRDARLLAGLTSGETTLAKLYKQGHPSVYEALSMTSCNLFGRCVISTMPYAREGKGITWQPTEHSTDRARGRFPDVLASVMTARRN